jgi:hypothetical protein
MPVYAGRRECVANVHVYDSILYDTYDCLDLTHSHRTAHGAGPGDTRRAGTVDGGYASYATQGHEKVRRPGRSRGARMAGPRHGRACARALSADVRCSSLRGGERG